MPSSVRRRALALAVLTAATLAACSASPGAGAPSTATGTPTVTASAPPVDAVTPTPSPTVTEPAVPDAPPPAEPAPVEPGPGLEVVLTSAGWSESTRTVQLVGYVQVVEPGGTCTARLTRGSEVVEVAQEAWPDATTTSCGTVDVPRERLTNGRWDAELSYDSPTSSGTSKQVEIDVP